MKLVHLMLCKDQILSTPINNDSGQVSPHCSRKEMSIMPWYTNPAIFCKVLNKIASRYELSTLQELNTVLDNAVASILKKQEQYHSVSHQQ